ncbi:MAG: GTPase, partial [Patescibacteria group bacterium]
IIADIPGLIEGAAEGKGLGHKFLRHIRRTKVLAHLISLENEDVVLAYKTIRAELERFDKTLLEKPEIIILTKTDLITDQKKLKSFITKIKKLNPKVFTVTVYDNDLIKTLQDALVVCVR